MRLFWRSPTNKRPCESKASVCGQSNSPMPAPFLPQVLRNLPCESNFMMRAFAFGCSPWPSATNRSPLGATATSVGWSKVSKPGPDTPALPMVISTLPFWSNLKTCWPWPFFSPLSATHRLPSWSTVILWGLTKSPLPKLLRSLPEVSNSRTGSSGEPKQFVPREPKEPQRSMAQILPFGPTAIPAVDPHFLPPGNWPQLTPARYGLGRSLRAPSGETAGGCWVSVVAFADSAGDCDDTALTNKAESRRHVTAGRQKVEKRSRGGKGVFTLFLLIRVATALRQ